MSSRPWWSRRRCRRTTSWRASRSRPASTCSSRSRRRCSPSRWRSSSGLARDHDRVLMPGHLLLYHPGVRKLKELVDSGVLGDVLCVYGNRQNLGVIRSNENALWSLGVHDLSVILWLLDEEPDEAVALGRDFLQPGVEDVVFCYLRFPSGKVAHMHLSWLDPHKMRKMTVVGREKMAVFDDMELERKVTVYEKAPWEPAETYGEWRTRTGDIFSTEDRERRAAAARGRALPLARRARAGRPPRGAGRARRRPRPRSAHGVAPCRLRSIRPRSSTRDHGARRRREGARARRRGKQPTLSPRSTAKRDPLPPTVIGAGTVVSTGAIVFAGDDRRQARDPRRPVVRAGAGHDRQRRRRRPRLPGGERHDDRRPDEDPGRRLHHRVLHARGTGLRRAVRRDDERQLHGPDRAAPRSDEGADDPSGAPASAAGRSSARGSRSARRRSSRRRRDEGRAARGRRRPAARVLRGPTTNCSTPSGVARAPRQASLRARAARLRHTSATTARREVGARAVTGRRDGERLSRRATPGARRASQRQGPNTARILVDEDVDEAEGEEDAVSTSGAWRRACHRHHGSGDPVVLERRHLDMDDGPRSAGKMHRAEGRREFDELRLAPRAGKRSQRGAVVVDALDLGGARAEDPALSEEEVEAA